MPEIYLAIDDHELVVTVKKGYLLPPEHYPVGYVPIGVSAWISVLEKK